MDSLISEFPSAWKVASIALTGCFGILGLVTEFKNPTTKKLTMWGGISLAGIVISTSLGIVAQVKELSEQQKTAKHQQDKIAEDTKQTLEISQRTNEAVVNLRRLVTPKEPSHITITLSASCSNEYLAKFCRKVDALATRVKARHVASDNEDFEMQEGATEIWGQMFHKQFGMKFAIFCDHRYDSMKFERTADSSLKPDLEFQVYEDNTNKANNGFNVTVENAVVALTIVGAAGHGVEGTGNVADITKLAGCKLAIRYNPPTWMMPTLLVMRNYLNNLEVQLDPDRFIKLDSRMYQLGYQFDASGT